MGLTIKPHEGIRDFYKVYAPSKIRGEPLIGSIQLSSYGLETKWYFVPILGAHTLDEQELSGIAKLLRDLGRGEKVHVSPPEQDYTVFVPRDPYDVD